MNTFKCWLIAQTEVLGGLVFILGILLMQDDGAILKTEILPSYLKSIWLLTTIASAAFVLSTMITIFTWRNFEEVVSRSLVWRRSNVDLFSMKIKYSLNIFIQILIISIALTYEIIVFVTLYKGGVIYVTY